MNFNKPSMIDVAVKTLENTTTNGLGIKFADLWAIVKEACEITPEEEADRIGGFYTDLSFSGKVVALPDNVWELRSRLTYDKVHIDVSDVYTDVAESDDDATDAQENAEYDQSVQGAVSSSDLEEEEVESEDLSESTKTKERDAASEALGKDVL